MQINNIMKSEILQGIKANARSFFAFVSGAIHKLYARIRANRRLCWFIGLMGIIILICVYNAIRFMA